MPDAAWAKLEQLETRFGQPKAQILEAILDRADEAYVQRCLRAMLKRRHKAMVGRLGGEKGAGHTLNLKAM
jgi:hypothetical protein